MSEELQLPNDPATTMAPETAAILAAGLEAVRSSLASIQSRLSVICVQAEQSDVNAQQALDETRTVRSETAALAKEMEVVMDLQQQIYRVVLLGDGGAPSLKEMVFALKQQHDETARLVAVSQRDKIKELREGARELREDERSSRDFYRNLLVNIVVAAISGGLTFLATLLIK